MNECHFCAGPAIVLIKNNPSYGGAINEEEMMFNFTCRECGCYYISSSFMEYNNEKENVENWRRWKAYLQRRSVSEKNNYIQITTKNGTPPDGQ